MKGMIDETELARLEYLIEASESCGYSTESDDPNMQYLAAACHYTPALVAEVRRLREALNKEHRAWQCADARGDWLEMENAALREKVEAWEWWEEVRTYDPWSEHPYCTACGNRSKRGKIFDCAVDEYEKIKSTAREAIHADRE